MAKSASTEKTFKDTSLKIVVFDEDGTDASRALAGFIGKKHKLKTLENDKDTIMQALYFQSVDYVLTINEGYGEKLLSDDTSALFSTYHMHDSYATVMVSQLLDTYVSAVRAYSAGGASHSLLPR